MGTLLRRLSFSIGILIFSWQPAGAIVWGEPDDANRYDHVGVVINGEELCSGVLLSPTLFVTAAHCVDDTGPLPFPGLFVFFGQDLAAPDAFSAGFPVLHPDFQAIQMGPDVAVIPLLLPVLRAHYGQLPDLGLLDQEATARGSLHDRAFATVGYGLQDVVPEPQIDNKRHVGEVFLINSVGELSFEGLYANFTSNAAHGGACIGDSGGPVFDGDSDVVVGVVSFGLGVDLNCGGNSVASRLDVQEVIDFIDAFLP